MGQGQACLAATYSLRRAVGQGYWGQEEWVGEVRGQELGLGCGVRGNSWTPQWKCPQMPERTQGPGRWNTEPQPQGHPHSGRPGAERRGQGSHKSLLASASHSTLLLGCYLRGLLPQGV